MPPIAVGERLLVAGVPTPLQSTAHQPAARRPAARRSPIATCYTDALVGAWRSPVAHRYGVPVVGGSNPLAPTLSPRQARVTRGRFVVLSDFHDDGSIVVVGPWSGARRAGLRR